MTTNTTPTDLKDYPEVRHVGAPERPGPPPHGPGKPKKRGILWVLLRSVIAERCSCMMWKAGQPGAIPQQGQGFGGGRGKKGRGGAGLGPVPVVTAKARRADVPVYLNGLGNVSRFLYGYGQFASRRAVDEGQLSMRAIW